MLKCPCGLTVMGLPTSHMPSASCSFCWTSRTCPSKVGVRIRKQPNVLVVRVGANLIRNADKHRENGVVQSHAFPMHEQPACVLANGWPVQALFHAQLRFGDLFKIAWWNVAANQRKTFFCDRQHNTNGIGIYFSVYLV